MTEQDQLLDLLVSPRRAAFLAALAYELALSMRGHYRGYQEDDEAARTSVECLAELLIVVLNQVRAPSPNPPGYPDDVFLGTLAERAAGRGCAATLQVSLAQAYRAARGPDATK